MGEEITRYLTSLDNYEEKLTQEESARGLPRQTPSGLTNLVQAILEDEPGILNKLSADELGERAATLLQFTVHLQLVVNRLVGRVNYLDDRIKKLLADLVKSTPGSYYQEKLLWAIGQSEEAQTLDRARRVAQLKLDRYNFLAHRVEAFAEGLLKLQYARNSKRTY